MAHFTRNVRRRLFPSRDDDDDTLSPPSSPQKFHCAECVAGDVAGCAPCLRRDRFTNVCIDAACDTETPAFFCPQCVEYWCAGCLREARRNECPLASTTCPRCTPAAPCLLCPEGCHSCTLCCREHTWSRVDELRDVWISEPWAEGGVEDDLLAPIYCTERVL